MEKLKNAISILIDVVSTMDTISVTGIDNQDKFVGCATAIKIAEKSIRDYISAATSSTKKEKQEVTDVR